MNPQEELIIMAFAKQLNGPIASVVKDHRPGQIAVTLTRLLAQSQLEDAQRRQSCDLARKLLSLVDQATCQSETWRQLVRELGNSLAQVEPNLDVIDGLLARATAILGDNGLTGHEAYRALVSADAERAHQLEAKFDRLSDAEAASTGTGDAQGLTARQSRALVAKLAAECGESNEMTIVHSSIAVGGYSKLTILATLQNNAVLPDEVVIRIDRPESPVGSTIAFEYPLLAALNRLGLKVPAPLFADLEGAITGGAMMITSREAGTIIADPHRFTGPTPPPELARSLARELAGIHRVPLSELPDTIRGLHRSNREMVIADLDHLRTTWDAAGSNSIIVEAAFRWLTDNVEAIGEHQTLVHGDIRFNNILVEDDRISAVLDWELASVGNPAFDLGYTYHHASKLMRWQEFLEIYADAGGAPVSTEEIRFFALRTELFAVVYLAKLQAGISSGVFENIDLIYAGTHVLQHNLYLLAKRLDAVLNGELL